jgi:charged multivesicular body protein 3
MYKVTGSMQKSTEIMKLSNQLIKLPEVSKVMREMSSEMMKVRIEQSTCRISIREHAHTYIHYLLFLHHGFQAGIMEEMMEDTLDSGVLGEDEDEMEDEAQGEVDKILFELTDGKLGQVQSDSLPELRGPEPVVQEDEGREKEDMQRMQDALDGLLRG